MCCCASYTASQEYRDKVKRSKKGKMVTIWKQLYYNSWRHYLYAPYRRTKYKAGWNESNRKTTRVPKNAKNQINEDIYYVLTGVHCYITKPKDKYGSLVKCRAYIDDFVGCDARGHAVFTKVFISQEEYDNAMLSIYAINNLRSK